MNIRLISNDADYEAALAEIKRLWNARRGSPDRDKLELLAMLAHQYERTRDPLPQLDPIDAIKFRMEQQGLSPKDLLSIFGSSGRISEVLSGKRALTLEMIRRLHAALDIPLESLIGTARRARAEVPRRGKGSRAARLKNGRRSAA